MIAINAKAALQHPRTGLEEYSYQLISHLIHEAERRGLEKYLLLYAPRWALMPQEFLGVSLKILKAPYIWTQGRLALEFLWNTPDIFFNPEQILPYFSPRSSVVTVHDVAYEIYPQYYSQKHQKYLHFVTRRAVKKAKKIIAISERTKRDISKFYGVPQRNITVIHHGFSSPSDSMKREKAHEITTIFPLHKEQFFLFIGRMEYKKNIPAIIEAFELFSKKTRENFHLVLAGPPGFGFEYVQRRINVSPLRERILYLGYVDGEMKYELLKNAAGLLFISLYEGFGLPILEAQSFGVPVITSNTSSLPEVVGEGGFLVNPTDPQEVAAKMVYLITHPKMRAYIIRKGYENIERFSWEKTAKETLDLLLSLA